MEFVRSCKSSPVATLQVLMADAVLQVHPEVTETLGALVPSSNRKALGCPNTFKNCAGAVREVGQDMHSYREKLQVLNFSKTANNDTFMLDYVGILRSVGFEDQIASVRYRATNLEPDFRTVTLYLTVTAGYFDIELVRAFSDDGAEYVIDKRADTSTSARIILGSVDNFHTERREGRPKYCMDFLYDGGLHVKGVLLGDKEAAEKWEAFDESLRALP